MNIISEKESSLKKIYLFFICFIPVLCLWANDFPLEISSVKIYGNKHISRHKLLMDLPVETESFSEKMRRYIPLMSKQKKTLYYLEDIQNTEKTIINRYQKNGFLKVKVSSRLVSHKKDYQLVLFIKEEERVKISQIDIFCHDKPEVSSQLVKKTARWINSDYSDEQFIQIKNHLEKTLSENAYLRYKVNHSFDINHDSTQVKISFNIETGEKQYIEDIQIYGLTDLKQEIVMRQIPLKDSTLYNPAYINWYKQQLSQLNHFNSINTSTELIEDKTNMAHLSFRVSEKKKHQFKSGIGYGLEDQVRAFIEYSQINFYGNARQLQIYAKRSALEPWNLSIKTREPLPFRHSLYGMINPFWLRQHENLYKLDRTGLMIGVSQQLNMQNSYQLHYLFEQNHLLEAEVYESDDLKSVYNKSSLYFYWLSDYVIKQHGLNSSLNLNYSGLGFGSKYHFLRGINDSRFYFPLSKSNSMAFRLKYGLLISYDSDKVVPVEERFYAGGANSIRGWSRNHISPLNTNQEKTGGNRLLELSAEYRILLFDHFEFALFVDSGNVWNKHADMNHLLTSAGTGLRYYSQLGPIRFDIARPVNINNWQFYIQIGQSF